MPGPRLAKIRCAVTCDLQLIANANCLPACPYEMTHMHLLSDSSRLGGKHGGFSLDYCILHCSQKRLAAPVSLLRGVWIRPEDLSQYEAIGYRNFKIVERSCPGDLLVKRVAAYAARRFEGNLLELVGQVAQIKKEQGAPAGVRLGLIRTFFKPWLAPLPLLLKMKRYADLIVQHDYTSETGPLHIDNRALDGFLAEVAAVGCGDRTCDSCLICESWAERAVRVDEEYRRKVMELGREMGKIVNS